MTNREWLKSLHVPLSQIDCATTFNQWDRAYRTYIVNRRTYEVIEWWESTSDEYETEDYYVLEKWLNNDHFEGVTIERSE